MCSEVLTTSPGIFSCLIIVLCGNDDYFTKMLIISDVEICSKPMAILLYDDFFFFAFVLFCTGSS